MNGSPSTPPFPGEILRLGLGHLSHEVNYTAAPTLALLSYTVDVSIRLGEGHRLQAMVVAQLTELSTLFSQLSKKANELAREVSGTF